MWLLALTFQILPFDRTERGSSSRWTTESPPNTTSHVPSCRGLKFMLCRQAVLQRQAKVMLDRWLNMTGRGRELTCLPRVVSGTTGAIVRMCETSAGHRLPTMQARVEDRPGLPYAVTPNPSCTPVNQRFETGPGQTWSGLGSASPPKFETEFKTSQRSAVDTLTVNCPKPMSSL